MARLCRLNSSGMVACCMSRSAAEDLIRKHSELAGLAISCENGIKDTVISGPLESLETLVNICMSTKIKATRLQVPLAFHSKEVDPIMEEFSLLLTLVKLKSPVFPTGSSLYGRIFAANEVITAEYFAEQARQPVKFAALAKDMVESFPRGSVSLLEIGPSAASKWKLLIDPRVFYFRAQYSDLPSNLEVEAVL
jgi:acyl transferase domain-containing protein